MRRTGSDRLRVTAPAVRDVGLVLGLFLVLALGFGFAAAACSPLSEHVDDASAGPNGGFEVARDGLPVNWLCYTPATVPEGRFTLSLDRAEKREGAQSLRFDVASCSPAGGNLSPGLAQELDAAPGATYAVSFWIRSEGCDYAVRAGGVTPKESSLATLDSAATAAPGWRRVEHRTTLPTNARRLRFELSVTSPGHLWVDALTIEPVAGAPGS